MPVLRKRAAMDKGLYTHSSPPRVLSLSAAHIKQLIRNGDIDKLEQVVLEGQGKKLIGEYSADYKTRMFLKSVPTLISKISLIHDSVNSDRLSELQSILDEEPEKKKKLVMAKDEAGVGILHKAIYYDLKYIYRWLLDKFPQLTSMRDSEGRTPYFYSLTCKEPAVVQKLLINAGADPSVIDYRQRSAKYYATHLQELELPHHIMKPLSMSRKNTAVRDGLNFKKSNIRIWIHQRNLTNLQQVVWEGYGSKLLVEHSNNGKIKKFLEAVPFIMGLIKDVHCDVQNGDLEVLKNRIEPQVPVAVLTSKDANGLTPLHKAVGLGKESIVRYILNQAPNSVNVVDNDGRTPLHYAPLVKDDGKMFNLLVSYGADESVLDHRQKSAAYYKSRTSELDAKLLNVIPDCPRGTKEPHNFDWNMLTAAAGSSVPINGIIKKTFDRIQNGTKEKIGSEKMEDNEQQEPEVESLKEEKDESFLKELEPLKPLESDETSDEKNQTEDEDQERSIEGNKESDNENETTMTEQEENNEQTETDDTENIKADEENQEDKAESETEENEDQAQNGTTTPSQVENSNDNENAEPIESESKNTVDENESKTNSADSNQKQPTSTPSPNTDDGDRNNEDDEINNKQDDEQDNKTTEDQNAVEEKESETEGEGVIEGIVNGENEVEPVNNDGQDHHPGTGDEEIRSMIQNGNMEQLATIVLNGDGDRLVGQKSSNPELQTFLNNVPMYMTKIHRIHGAARDGSLRDLQAALDRRKFAVARDNISPNGASPLHVAVAFGRTSVVRYLAGRFPETLHAEDDNGRTPLHYAAVLKDNGHYYNLLMHLGADNKVKDKFDHTPEYYIKNQSDFSHRQMLIDFGAEEEAEDILNDRVPDDVYSARKNLDDDDMIGVLERCYTVLYGRRQSNSTISTSSALTVSSGSINNSVNSTNLLTKHLKRYVFETIKLRITKLDHNLYDVIWPSLKKVPFEPLIKLALEEDFALGITAPDFYAYNVFPELLLPMIKDFNFIDINHELKPHPKSKFFNNNNIDDNHEVNVDLDLHCKWIISGDVSENVDENNQVDMPFFATEEGRYLASSLGDPLIKGLTEVANKRPDDPIAYLATYLYNVARSRDGSKSEDNQEEHNQFGSTKTNNNHQSQQMARNTNNSSDVPHSIDVVTVEPEGNGTDDESAFNDTTRDEHGQSMLHFASARVHGRNALFQLLTETDISVAFRDELYRTARDISIQANLPENTMEIDRYVLYIATKGNTNKLVELLLEGYDHITDIVDEDGTAIIEAVTKANQMETVSFLQSILTFEEKRERVHHAIRQGAINDVMALLADEKDTGSGKLLAIGKNSYGRCSLHIAVLCQEEEIVDYLANTFSDTLRIGDNLERTALHYAMGVEKMEMITKVLIKAGAKRVVKDLKGRQPTYYYLNKSDILRLQEEEETF